ncbi:hypothetical protein LSAT2_005585 [Lamellibrachia satsuma]|nr:hypothetical protein LSAT2_005585 [Lamellibrachia satsuma]
MEAPRNSDEVRRLLGHVNYMGKFILNLSAESEPLRGLSNLPDKEFCGRIDQRTANKHHREATVRDDRSSQRLSNVKHTGCHDTEGDWAGQTPPTSLDDFLQLEVIKTGWPKDISDVPESRPTGRIVSEFDGKGRYVGCALYWAGWCIRHCRTAPPPVVTTPLSNCTPTSRHYTTVELHPHQPSLNHCRTAPPPTSRHYTTVELHPHQPSLHHCRTAPHQPSLHHCRTAPPPAVTTPLSKCTPTSRHYTTVELHPHQPSLHHCRNAPPPAVTTPLSNCTPMFYPPAVTTTYFSTLWTVCFDVPNAWV